MTQQILSGDSSNDGQVKINTGNGIRPRFGNGDPSIDSTWQKLTYASPLGLSSSPTTSWPGNIVTPDENDIYDFVNDTYIENTIPGQINTWRLQFEFNKQNSQASLQIQLRNTLSGFELITFVTVVSGFTIGEFTVTFISIADGASLPPPFGTGQGYEMRIMADTNSYQQGPENFIELTSLTRISSHYGPVHG